MNVLAASSCHVHRRQMHCGALLVWSSAIEQRNGSVGDFPDIPFAFVGARGGSGQKRRNCRYLSTKSTPITFSLYYSRRQGLASLIGSHLEVRVLSEERGKGRCRRYSRSRSKPSA